PVAEQPQAESSQQAELEQIWQQLLTHLHPLSRALLSQHGRLIVLREQEAKIGIRNQNLAKIVHNKLPDVEAIFMKVFNRQVRVSLQVVDLVEPTPSAQSSASNSPNWVASPKPQETISTDGPFTHRDNLDASSLLSPSQSSEATSISIIPGPVVEALPEQDENPYRPLAQEANPAPVGSPAGVASSWQQDNEVVRAAKSLAQFFNGEIVSQAQDAPPSFSESPLSDTFPQKTYELVEAPAENHESELAEPEESEDIPF
ncbi:MAG TPA: hypothetical protein V6D03_12110, partial [Candidatus Caenarcaniphilales bacterium]